jgi:hypothetical protein
MTSNLTPACANDNSGPLTASVIEAVNWAQGIPANVSITAHPEFLDHFGAFNQAEFVAAMDELERRANAAQAEAQEMLAYVAQRGDEQ